MSAGYWNADMPAGDFDDENYLRTHFDPTSMSLSHGRYIRVAATMAQKCPVVRSDEQVQGLITVSSYAYLQDIHRDDVRFSNFPCVVQNLGNDRPLIPMELDPPVHRPYKQIIAPLLGRAAQAGRESYYREIARSKIADFLHRGECDIFSQFCNPLTVEALMHSLGVPDEDRAKMAELGVAFVRGNHSEGKNKSSETASEIYEYFAELAAQKRRSPQNDLLTALCEAQIDGRPLTEQEVLDYCVLLLPAGFESTASTMSWIFLLLAENPELQERLWAEPHLLPAAIEEMLRYVTPVRSHTRTVREDVEIGGEIFRAGERIHLNWVGANHDPKAFERAGELVVDRHPNRHMSFGFGSHTCVGMHMARTEIKAAVSEALSAMRNIRLKDPAEVVEENGTIWAVTRLPVLFEQR